MEGKLIKFSEKEERMWTLALKGRDMEILKDVLEAHLEYLYDTLKNCVVSHDLKVQYEDDQVRISKMLELIDKED